MNPTIRILSTCALLAYSVSLFADSSCNVQVDCSLHIISVKGSTSRIDCGKPGHQTINGSGIIGGMHSGPIVHNGVEIVDFPGMGASGGGKVFHCTPGGVKGLNDSNGCVHLNPDVLSQLHNCQGSTLTITGAGEPAFETSQEQLAQMPTVVRQQYYGTSSEDSDFIQPSQSTGNPFSSLLNTLLNGSQGSH